MTTIKVRYAGGSVTYRLLSSNQAQGIFDAIKRARAVPMLGQDIVDMTMEDGERQVLWAPGETAHAGSLA